MVTASHNPAADDGYKIYWENGCQIISPHDVGISERISENLKPWCDYAALSSIQFVDVTEDAIAKYMAYTTLKLHTNANSLNEVGSPRECSADLPRDSLHGDARRRIPLREGAAGTLPYSAVSGGGGADRAGPDLPDGFLPQP